MVRPCSSSASTEHAFAWAKSASKPVPDSADRDGRHSGGANMGTRIAMPAQPHLQWRYGYHRPCENQMVVQSTPSAHRSTSDVFLGGKKGGLRACYWVFS